MNETQPAPVCQTCDEADKENRRKSLWHSFMWALYTAIGSASFIGVLTKVAGTAMGPGGFTAVGALMAGSGGVAMAALLVVGVVCVFMSQREYVETACLREENLARQNAKFMLGKTSEIASPSPKASTPVEEHPAPARKDGRSWQEATVRPPASAEQRAM